MHLIGLSRISDWQVGNKPQAARPRLLRPNRWTTRSHHFAAERHFVTISTSAPLTIVPLDHRSLLPGLGFAEYGRKQDGFLNFRLYY